jgi:hypothetical protein
MKKILLLTLTGLLALGALNSCEGEKEPPKALELTGGQTTQSVFADQHQAQSKVSFKSGGAWKSSISEGTRAGTWITINPSSGSTAGDYTITITLDMNYTGADRTATITIICGDEEITITVTQKATTEDGVIPEDPEKPSEDVAVTGVTLDKTNLSLVEGSSETLIATVAPSDATNQNVEWSSSDSAVASVDAGGKVTALKAGTAAITVTTADGGKTATCAVTVTAKTIDVTGVTLNKTSLSLVEGSSETLIATVAPSDATNQNVEWSSSNSAVASVDSNGKVTALKTGSATIIVSTVDGGKVATCNVTVSANPVGPGGDSDDWGDGGEIEL